jgi:hypothetical protein
MHHDDPDWRAAEAESLGPFLPPIQQRVARSLQTRDDIAAIQARTRLDDPIDRKPVHKILEQHLDRHACPVEDATTAQDLRIADNNVHFSDFHL